MDEDDPDGDGDDCGQTGGADSGDSGAADDDDDSSGSSDFLGISTTTTGGALSGLPVMLTMIPLAALAGIVFAGMVRAPRRIVSKRSNRGR